ncbi:hypothetical protein [Pedobacter sp. V48]|uniref:hypothetical protein n=1 Tax=Pedobacter sp. V48 TaxID=509635 RepID=UPI0003E5B319|nr:hypothetical protein [Pedobacter sp. V48]ETZ22432.1 hypothetical protein N824_01930 [Pedobacter sp. V48]
MKITIISTILMMASGSCFCQTAQTGVNARDPQQTVNVSGTPSTQTAITGYTGKYLVTPTMRVDGLNQVNNSTHPASPAISVLPLYATTNGELVISSNRVNQIVKTLPGAAGFDAISTPVTLVVTGTQTGIGTSVVTTPSSLITPVNFTLTRPSMIYINAAVSVGSVTSNTLISPVPPPPALPYDILEDGKARMMGIQFRFTKVAAGSGMPVNVPFASSTDSFTNEQLPTSGTNIITGFFYYNLGKQIMLPAGDYTFGIWGCAAGNGNPFRLIFGEATTDVLSITAIAL